MAHRYWEDGHHLNYPVTICESVTQSHGGIKYPIIIWIHVRIMLGSGFMADLLLLSLHDISVDNPQKNGQNGILEEYTVQLLILRGCPQS